MNHETIRQADAIFQRVIDAPEAERSALLERLCGGDATLRSFVEQLLSSDSSTATGLLDHPVIAPRTRLPLGAGVELFPRRIGPYEVVRVIGEGGMAIVFEARQESPRRTVALKVIRPGLGSRSLLRRFQHEADVLGQLQHPGIAHIYEAALADLDMADGSRLRQPFFAMELIRGEHLNLYAARRALTVGQRLGLMAQVCDAIQYAHQKGVIHRDLKPANILVVEEGENGRPLPKVLDFGVARVTRAELTGGTMDTQAGQLVGTLSYMSPEQVSGAANEIDTRSDVYALGVLLYELLCGSLPHDVSGVSLPDAVRRISEDAPPRLGTVDRRLRGEIETIVHRALERDRDRRYASAHDLASDIRRLLAGEPIEAKRDSALYILRKNAQRYRGALLAIAAIIVLLAGFALWAGNQARVNRDLAEDSIRARNLAYTERDRANKTADRLTLEISQSNIERGRALASAGNFPDAEKLLWREFLTAPGPSPRWALREFYARYPNRLSLATGVPLIRAIALSADGRRAFIGGDARHIEVWDVEQGRRLRTLTGHEGDIRQVALSADGRLLASSDIAGSILLWDCTRGDRLHRLHAAGDRIPAFCFSPDGSKLISGGEEGALRVWNVESGECLATYALKAGVLTCVQLSPSGRLLITGVANGLIVWDTAAVLDFHTRSGAESPATIEVARLGELKGHVERISSVAVSPDERLLASAGSRADRALRIWNLESFENLLVLKHSSGVLSDMAFASDNQTLYAAGWFGVDVWDAPAGKLAANLLRANCSSFALCEQRQFLAAGLRGDVRIWETDRSQAAGMPAFRRGHAAAFHPDGKQIAVSQADGRIELCDAATGAVLQRLEPEAGSEPRPAFEYRVRALSFNPAGTEVASISRDNVLRRWDIASGACSAVIPRANHITHQGVAYSPDERRWAYAREGATFALGPVDGAAAPRSLPAGGWEALAACFAPDGSLLATTSREPGIRLWSGEGEPLAWLESTGTPWGLAFSPDGARLLAGTWGFTIEVWDVARRALLRTLEGHSATVWGMAFSPRDPDVFVSFSADGTARIWSMNSGLNLATFEVCPGEEALIASFSPDGRWLLITCSGNDIRLFDLAQTDAYITGNLDFQLNRLRADPAVSLDEDAIRAAVGSGVR